MKSKPIRGPYALGMRSGHNGNILYARDGGEGDEAQFEDTAIASVYGLFTHRSVEEQPDNEGLATACLLRASWNMLKALEQIVVLAETNTTGADTNPPCKSEKLTAQQATSLKGAISNIARRALAETRRVR